MSYSTYKQGLVPAQHNNQIKKEALRAPIIQGVMFLGDLALRE
ncbi:MAG: hypothetical protein ACI9JU_002341 [Pseudohongiellaceae bacterium]|jgi:hypothetical protein